jgi:hypothetical protein
MKTTGPTHVCSSTGANLPLGHGDAVIHFMRTGFLDNGGTTWRVSDIQHRRHLSHRFDFSCYVPEEKLDGAKLYQKLRQMEEVALWESDLMAHGQAQAA